jgi:NADH dehydrogenase FAD-containing subunit
MAPTVAIVGGGYGGITVAKALDDIADVTLIEPRDTFVHNVAGLRAVVDPDWANRIFLPYDGLLARGQVRRDRAVHVSEKTVELGSGDTLDADYIVLATGSGQPYPAKLDVEDSARAKAKLHATHEALARAPRVLLLGAGPVGLEFAGEIKATWPEKAVTIVDPVGDIMSGRFPEEFRSELRTQIAELGIQLVLGTSLSQLPATEPGQAGTFTVTTGSDANISTDITADIWFACFGATVDSDYLGHGLRDARQPRGPVAVTPDLRVPGHDTVFAIGDLTALPEMKMARAAGQHGEVVAANIRTLIEGGDKLATYEPAADAIVLPLGPKGGASYTPELGVLGPGQTSDIKGTDLLVDRFLDILNIE